VLVFGEPLTLQNCSHLDAHLPCRQQLGWKLEVLFGFSQEMQSEYVPVAVCCLGGSLGESSQHVVGLTLPRWPGGRLTRRRRAGYDAA